MNEPELIELYNNRWEQVRHLNELDGRSLVLAVTGITGALIGGQQTALGPALQASAGILACVVCMGAIHSTIVNRESMIQALYSIQMIEAALRHSDGKLFPWAVTFRAPRNFSQYASSLLRSIRGPLLLFFTAALAMLLALLAYRSRLTTGLGKPTTVILATTVASLFLLISLLVGWYKARKRCNAINSSTKTTP